MRITVRRLRRLIEMSLASIQEPTTDLDWEEVSDEEEDDYRGGSFDSATDPEALKAKKQVHRFYKTPKYRDDAVRLFGKLSIPVYIVPAWTGNYGNTRGPRTWSASDSEEMKQKLVNNGISPQRADELIAEVEKGAAVLISLASKLEGGQWPTPWMLVHAMLDAEETVGDLDPVYSKLYDLIDTWFNAIPGDYKAKQQYVDRAWGAFTFRSARENKINGENDLAAEIITQEILTTKGFTYKETGVPEIDDVLAKMKEVVTGARQKFENAISGKVTEVEVSLEI